MLECFQLFFVSFHLLEEFGSDVVIEIWVFWGRREVFQSDLLHSSVEMELLPLPAKMPVAMAIFSKAMC
jgi:hypothetical protein